MEFVKQPFYDEFEFQVIQEIEKCFSGIKREFNDAVFSEDYTQWHQKDLYNEGWNVFGFRFFKENIESAHRACPYTSKFIRKFDDLILTAGFSILKPGTVIFPHTGYTDEVLRCHLGISIPDGDCGIKVNGITRKWKEGKAFVFDDTYLHEAWNHTLYQRVVMLLDFDKRQLFA